MNVLVGCEYSGIVRDAFIRAGHHAVSVDILPSESDFGPHHQRDIFQFLETDSTVWDLAIFHPPCTYLATSGIHWNKKRPDRQKKTDEALEFVRKLMELDIEKIAIENPRSVISSNIRPADQMVHPYMFGEPKYKGIHLWLKGLPKLVETRNVKDNAKQWIQTMGPSKDRAKKRSKFFIGVAEAMASQWGGLENQSTLDMFGVEIKGGVSE